MIVVDTSLLIYAVNDNAALHRKAKAWLKTVLSSTDTVGFSWVVLLAFLRLTTKPGIFRQPMGIGEALDVMDAWLAQPSAVTLSPGVGHGRILRDLLTPLGTGGSLTSDAHLTALAIEHGAELCSCDADFSRFPRLRWRNPLR